ncbi:MAG TPA: DUF6600 domain-containing protein [Rhodanobacteraceae bacterium]|nr:DUF6600 domain-containing protein [Rhodanobacteraceae bacterium]
MTRFRLLRPLLVATGICALLIGAVTVQAQQYDGSQPYAPSGDYDSYDLAPGRVARLAYLSGQVQFAPAGGNDWGSIEINRPMVIGDRLLTGGDGRAALELGDASVRIDHGSAFDFLNLDQDNVQIELSQGTLNLAVRQMGDGENFEVDTPTIAFVASTPGVYRIDNSPDGVGSMVTVFRGSGIVYGENGASRQVVEGTSYRFNDSSLASVDVNGLPEADDFDRFCETRDANYERYAQAQQQYVPPGMIGGEDLYQYGQWNPTPTYGNVWYPRSVPAGWAPYRYGHWAWIDPWGWTWVDNQPWGFAPFHYGRWVYVSNRWGWVPGPVNVRPVYAPALVAFVGGSGLSVSLRIGGGSPVGWFPLGPRDVYVPWFRSSRGYFTNVNVTNIRNVYVNRTVINNIYNDYSSNRTGNLHRYNRYAYRNIPGAVTAVPRNVFTGARPVHPAVLKLDRNQLARTRVAMRPGVNPDAASLGLRHPTARPRISHGREPFARPVVARHAPPPRPVEFAARQKAIARQHGQPLTAAQMSDLRRSRPVRETRDARVKLVPRNSGVAEATRREGATAPHPATPAARIPRTRSAAVQHPIRTSAERGNRSPQPRSGDTARPVSARNPAAREPALRPGELRSARFRNPERVASLPRAPVIRPAHEPRRAAPPPGRLPVVKPVERAPQSITSRAAPQRRQADVRPAPRPGTQPPRPQRHAQEQARQRAQAQQAERQRAAQAQTQQRARQQRQLQVQAQQRDRAQQAQRQRDAQMQQQRQAQMEAGQRAREQAMQRQRASQMQAQRRNTVAPRQPQMQRPPARQAPQPRNRPEPAHHKPRPSHKHPDKGGGNAPIR